MSDIETIAHLTGGWPSEIRHELHCPIARCERDAREVYGIVYAIGSARKRASQAGLSG